MRESHGHALRGSEAVFTIQNHAMAAVEQDNGGAGTLVLALVHHQVAILQVDGHLGSFTPNGVGESLADVEIQRVPEFVRPRNAAGLDARGKIARIVAAKAAAAERTQQIAKGLETEEVDGLVGDLKACIGTTRLRITQVASRRGLRRESDLRGLLRIDEAFLRKAFNEFVDQVADFAIVQRSGIL